jgi:hypothetical protein
VFTSEGPGQPDSLANSGYVEAVYGTAFFDIDKGERTSLIFPN